MHVFKLKIKHFAGNGKEVKHKTNKEPPSVQVFIKASSKKKAKKWLDEETTKNDGSLILERWQCPWKCGGRHEFNLEEVKESQIPKGAKVIRLEKV